MNGKECNKIKEIARNLKNHGLSYWNVSDLKTYTETLNNKIKKNC